MSIANFETLYRHDTKTITPVKNIKKTNQSNVIICVSVMSV